MGRYNDTQTKLKNIRRGKNNNQTYSINYNLTTYYSAIPESDNDIYVITQSGDRLDNLAFQFYGNVSLWWYIAKANNLTSITIEAGKRLRIPATTEYAIGR